MPNLYDLAYATGLVIAAPFWMIKSSARRKVCSALRGRMSRDVPTRTAGPCVMIHAVSVGEVHVVPALIAELKQRAPGLQFIVSTTTETGAERAKQLFANEVDVTLIRFPLDFSGSISRVLERLKPGVVVLMELELWPNFMRQCRARSIPVVVANGRITPPSFRRYRRAALFTKGMFASLTAAAVQDETYAGLFRQLGVPDDRVKVLGTMKFDSATLADKITGDDQLAAEVGLRPGEETIWVCGSTGRGEEQIILDVYQKLLAAHPTLRLAIIPRHPPRFNEVANLIRAAGFNCVRRSTSGQHPTPNNQQATVVLGDTMGELRKFYSFATVVFVGRSLVDLGPRQHGSDMIEPAALAKPVIVGPFTGNFDMPIRLLREADAISIVQDASMLHAAVDALLKDGARRYSVGRRAQDVVRGAQGATARHAGLIMKFLGHSGR